MDGAKITFLGLRHLIRLSLFTDYLSFLGGEAQRPTLNCYSRALAAEDSPYLRTPKSNYKDIESLPKRVSKFLSPSRLFFLRNVPSTKVTREKSLINKFGLVGVSMQTNFGGMKTISFS